MKRLAFAVALALLGCGCMRSIHCTVKEGGWDVSYLNVGLKTDISALEVEKTEAGGVRVKIDGVVTDVSTETKEIVASTGALVGSAVSAAIK